MACDGKCHENGMMTGRYPYDETETPICIYMIGDQDGCSKCEVESSNSFYATDSFAKVERGLMQSERN